MKTPHRAPISSPGRANGLLMRDRRGGDVGLAAGRIAPPPLPERYYDQICDRCGLPHDSRRCPFTKPRGGKQA